MREDNFIKPGIQDQFPGLEATNRKVKLTIEEDEFHALEDPHGNHDGFFLFSDDTISWAKNWMKKDTAHS